MDIQEVGWAGMDCIVLTQKRDGLAGYCECDRDPSVSIK
jgi:hypothetical protein